MKKIINILTIVLCSYSSIMAQQAFTIKGNLSGLKTSMKVMFYYEDNGKKVMDSSITENGKFIFSGMINRPVRAGMYLKLLTPTGKVPKIGDVLPQSDWANFMIDPGVTEINGPSLVKATISGGQTQKDFSIYNTLVDQRMDTVVRIWREQRKALPEDSAASFKRLLYARSVIGKELAKNFISSHTDSYVSFDLVSGRAIVVEEPKEVNELYAMLSQHLKDTQQGKVIGERIALATKFSIGAPAENFSQADDKGKIVSLSDFKGKYVLIDFWASWCGPCRTEYPFLHKAYDKYKSKNFEIVGVSLDDKKSLWLNAIKDNSFDWVELCDLNGRKNAVAITYGVAAIPQSFLIDPNGKIIAKNLRGNDLLDKLDAVLSTQNYTGK
ncbi:redoxin domain-containing protein [Pedobacter sp. PWIIR3]